MINSVCGFGSTGSICVDIANSLEAEGHKCYIAYGQRNTTYHRAYKIGTKIENHLHNLQSRAFGNQGYYSKNGTRKLIDFIKELKPDVIHLHNLHGNYLRLETLFKYLSSYEGKIVWTLHDCWAFTGKCTHYTDVNCQKWQTQCYKCPQVHKYPPSIFFDRTRGMYQDKKKWFSSINNPAIITVSNWLRQEVRKSFLKNKDIHMIYNWIDHRTFRPYGTSRDILDKYRLRGDIFTVITVSSSWTRRTAKWDDLTKLVSFFKDPIQFIVVGKINHKLELPPNCIHIDYVHNKIELAKLYNIADVYVHLSTEDTFGKVIAEAMSCGTPAIVYDSTACPEILGKNCGYVVSKRDVKGIKKAIEEVRKNKKSFYSDYCRNQVLTYFDYRTNVNKTIDIYKALV